MGDSGTNRFEREQRARQMNEEAVEAEKLKMLEEQRTRRGSYLNRAWRSRMLRQYIGNGAIQKGSSNSQLGGD